ncbi:MAG: hypothetical protein RR330_01350 [Alistipes sp.]
MMKNLLFPHSFKKAGWVIFIPTFLLGAVIVFNLIDWHNSHLESLLNNIALIGSIIGAIFIVCSKEKIEDEMIASIRLNSLLTALYINYALLIIAALFFYDLDFFGIMVYNLITVLLLFLVLYQGCLWYARKNLKNEE